MTNAHKPGIYSKKDARRVAHSPSEAVSLAFEGWSRVADLPKGTEPQVEEKPNEQPSSVAAGTPVPSAPKPTAPKTKKD